MSFLGTGVGVPFKNKFVGGSVDPGLALLQSATLWLNAGDPGSDSQKLANRGTGGTALDARFGSTTGVDTNDPLLLTHTGTNYLYLPGLASNGTYTVNAAALNVTGDIDIQVRVALDDWTPSGVQYLVAKRKDGAVNFAYVLAVKTTGVLTFDYGNTSTTIISADSTVATGHTDNTSYWVRVTRASATGTVTFYTAADSSTVPSTWSQLGGTVATAAGSIYAGTNFLYVGGAGSLGAVPTFGMASGKVYRARVLDGIAGTTVFDADFTANTGQSTFTESSSNAATVTINRATSGRKSVMVVRPTLLFGTDDYLEIADNALLDIDTNEQMTVIVAHREWATPVANSCFVTKFTGNFDEGWSMLRIAGATHQVRAFLESGASNVTAASGTTYSAGTYGLRGIQIDRVAQTALGTEGSTVGATTSISGLGTFVNTAALRIGTNGGAVGAFTDMELTHVAIFKGTLLTSTQLGQIATYLGV